MTKIKGGTISPLCVSVYVDGDLKWAVTSGEDTQYIPTCIRCDIDGSFYVGGYKIRAYGENTGFVDKYSSNGKLLWSVFNEKRRDNFVSNISFLSPVQLIAHGKMLSYREEYVNTSMTITASTGRVLF